MYWLFVILILIPKSTLFTIKKLHYSNVGILFVDILMECKK